MRRQPEKFSGNCEKVRRQLELSQEKLTHALGMSFATVNRWENGRTGPSKMTQSVWQQFCRKKIDEGKLTDE
jgi:putative transcriptional regulator